MELARGDGRGIGEAESLGEVWELFAHRRGRKRMGSIVSFVDFVCSGLGISLSLKCWFVKFSLVFF